MFIWTQTSLLWWCCLFVSISLGSTCAYPAWKDNIVPVTCNAQCPHVFISHETTSVQCVYAGSSDMWPWEDVTCWCSDAASDCLAFPLLFRKYQSPPTQFLHSPFDANVAPVTFRILGMLEIVSLYTGRHIVAISLPVPQKFRWLITKVDRLLLIIAYCQLSHDGILFSCYHEIENTGT